MVDRKKETKQENGQITADRYTINSVEKALDVIEMLSLHHSLSLIDLVELVKQPKSSLYRIILTLEKRGFIARSDEDGKYCLGYKQLVITRNMMERSSLRTAALTDMNKLMEDYGDTVNLCVLSDHEVLYVEIIEGTYALRMSDHVGSKAPFHATATGKAMAAFLPIEETNKMINNRGLPSYTAHTIVNEAKLLNELEQIKKQGFALDNEEFVEGARCIAAPIFNRYGKIEGAISLSGARHRFPDEQVLQIAKSVTEAARNISQKLGYVVGP